MKNQLKWLEGVLVLAPFAAIGVLWNQIPERIPMHWNLRGEIDQWASSKPIGIFITPLIAVALVALLRVLPWLDPKLRKTLEEHHRMHAALQIMRITLAVFFAAVVFLQIATPLGYGNAGGRILMSCVLMLLAILGNYLPALRPNYFVGIRTPWTLENSETWRATHRLGGRLMFFGAVFLIILDFFLSPGVFGVVFMIAIGLLVIWSFLYSWYHFRKHASLRDTA